MSSDVEYTEDEQKFVDFIESYSSYHKPAYIISMDNKGVPLLNNKKGKNQFPMYDLDKMCGACTIFWHDGIAITPKTTDALWFKKDEENGVFYIILVEFKGDKLYHKSNKCELVKYLKTLKDRFRDNPFDDDARMDIPIIEKIIKKYSDKMLNGLALKPLETITIALPLLYQDYCNKHEDVESFDIVGFLRNSEIIYRVVTILDEENNDFPENPTASHLQSAATASEGSDICIEQGLVDEDMELLESYEANLATYYYRYAKANIICDTKNFIDKSGFNNFINDF